MKKSYSLFLSLFLFLLSELSFSATYYSRANGNWNTLSTWSTTSCSGALAGTIPGPSDNVIICTGRTITMNGNPASCLSLTVNGTANWTNTFTTNVGTGGLFLNNGGSLDGTSIGVLNVNGPFSVPAAALCSIGGISMTITGTSTVSGNLNWGNNAGTKNIGSLIVASTGTWNNAINEDFKFNGDFQNNGTFNSGTTAINTFSGSGKSISGTSATTISRFDCSGSYTNNGNLIISLRFVGTGSFSQGPAGVLNIACSDTRFTIATFNASAVGNTVTFARSGAGMGLGNQTVRLPSDGSYSSLTIAGNGTKYLAASASYSGNVLISGATLATNNFNMTVAGNFTNNSAFTAGTGTVTFN
ncbi:MAG TPA: hypothetical protein VGC65_02365, partial [Bacteroidia bacterium]